MLFEQAMVVVLMLKLCSCGESPNSYYTVSENNDDDDVKVLDLLTIAV